MRARAYRSFVFSSLYWGLVIPAGGVAYGISGMDGMYAAALAGVVCWIAGWCAILLVAGHESPERVVLFVVAGMLPRMGIPLIVCFFVYLQGSVLVEVGFVYYILVFYLITLAIDSWLFFRYRQSIETQQTTG